MLFSFLAPLCFAINVKNLFIKNLPYEKLFIKNVTGFYLEKTRVLERAYLFENKVFAQTNTGQRAVRIRSDCFFSILFTY